MLRKSAVRSRRTFLGATVLVFAAVLGSVVLHAQDGPGTQSAKMMSKDAHPIFDVATIKPSNPNTSAGTGLAAQGRHISYTGQTARDLVLLAYGIQKTQLVNAPAWLGTERYDIDGVPDMEGTPNLRQMQEMFRKLLAERFNLKVHSEKRELAVYTLTLGKGGMKIDRSQADPDALPGVNLTRMTPQLVTLKATNASIADFLLEMEEILDKPMLDQTGLTGKFDFTLQWAPDESQLGALGMHPPSPADNAIAHPGVFTAIQEQLGLKLNALKAPAEVVVIDEVGRPSAN
jgi:uncharacterized protein (TIGR03435 family)